MLLYCYWPDEEKGTVKNNRTLPHSDPLIIIVPIFLANPWNGKEVGHTLKC